MRSVTITRVIPGEWDVTSSGATPKHFTDWDNLVRFVSGEFDAQTTANEKLDAIAKIVDNY
jgi:hypothetical protein